MLNTVPHSQATMATARQAHASRVYRMAAGRRTNQLPARYCSAAATSNDGAATTHSRSLDHQDKLLGHQLPRMNSREPCNLSRRAGIAQLLSLVAAGAAAASPSAPASSTRSCGAPVLAALQVDYDEFASTYDQLDDGSLSKALGFQDLRQQLLAQVLGDVLEVAVGTGLNLPLYSWQGVTQLTAVDLSQGMLDQAAARAAAALPGRPIQLQQANVEALPFPDDSFDCVVDTFSLCVFPRPDAALKEMARVLKPGGRLLLLEHSRSSNALLAAYQDVTNSAVVAMSKGCAWNQDVDGLLRGAGLKPVQLEQHVAGTVVMVQAQLV